jgi:DNA end-binding protein Ku
MAPRPHWKGYLKLSLVSCPIALYPAISAAERVSFRQVNRETGHRLRQQLVDSVTGTVVETHNKARGYEVGENQFLMVQDQELEAARQEARARPFSAPPARPEGVADQAEEKPPRRGAELTLAGSAKRDQLQPPAPPLSTPPPTPVRIENNRTIALDRFVPRDEIDPRYYNTPYYIAPRDEVGQEAFAVIRDAMAAKGLVGIGRVVLANRERPVIIEPMGLGMRGITLRYAHEVRNEVEYFADIPKLTLPDEMVRLTEHILEKKQESFDPAYLEDRYRTVLVEKLREKQAKLPLVDTAPSKPSSKNVINLMDVLRRSLAVEKPSERKRSAAKVLPKRSDAATKSKNPKRSRARTGKTV